MSAALYTSNQVPSNMEIKELFPMIQMTGTMQISRKGIVQSFIDRNKNEQREIMDAFSQLAPLGANAIIDVKISTASQSFSNATFLYITYIGTPAIVGTISN